MKGLRIFGVMVVVTAAIAAAQLRRPQFSTGGSMTKTFDVGSDSCAGIHAGLNSYWPFETIDAGPGGKVDMFSTYPLQQQESDPRDLKPTGAANCKVGRCATTSATPGLSRRPVTNVADSATRALLDRGDFTVAYWNNVTMQENSNISGGLPNIVEFVSPTPLTSQLNDTFNIQLLAFTGVFYPLTVTWVPPSLGCGGTIACSVQTNIVTYESPPLGCNCTWPPAGRSCSCPSGGAPANVPANLKYAAFGMSPAVWQYVTIQRNVSGQCSEVRFYIDGVKMSVARWYTVDAGLTWRCFPDVEHTDGGQGWRVFSGKVGLMDELRVFGSAVDVGCLYKKRNQ